MTSYISLIILLLKYTILKFHFNAVLSRAFSKTFKINQELEENISVLFFPSLVLRANSSSVSPLTSAWFLFIGAQISHLRYPTFYNHQPSAISLLQWMLIENCFQLELRTIFLNYRQDCKYLSSNLVFSFKQTEGGNEAV